MENQVLPGLKLTFLVHAIVAILVGLIFTVVPQFWWTLVGQTMPDLGVARVFGVAILAFGISSWWAYRETFWSHVKIVTEMELVWTILGALITAYGLLFENMILAACLMVFVLGAFAIAFGYFYVRETALTTRAAPR